MECVNFGFGTVQKPTILENILFLKAYIIFRSIFYHFNFIRQNNEEIEKS